jgi:hypothetical protein
MKQGDPCPECGVPIYASAGFSLPGGCFSVVFQAIRSVFTVCRGGVGSITFGETPTAPVEAACINCGKVVTIESMAA